MTNLTNAAMGELRDIAKEHPSFESFLQEMQRFADHVWHDVRTAGDQADATLDSDDQAAQNYIYGDGTEKAPETVEAPPASVGGPGVPGSPASASDPSQATETRSSEELTGHPDAAQ
jgi:hypothetical protein